MKIQKTTTKRELLSRLALPAGGYLLAENADAKTRKGASLGVLTGILYLMPDDVLCPVSRLAGCREACLVSAGRAAYTPGIGEARARRTKAFHADRDAFMALLVEHEIPRIIRKAQKHNMEPAIRLNGTSDINWAVITYKGKSVFEHYPDVQFYDYTKSPSILRAAAGKENWHITASYSEASDKYSDLILAAAKKYGANIAVVFRKNKPATYKGMPVIDGDETDVRFKDTKGVIVGLKAKGKAKKDNSGFVVDDMQGDVMQGNAKDYQLIAKG